MKIIPTALHGMLDYLVAILFIITPAMLGFGHNKPAAWVFILLGIGTIFYSLFTDYEFGVFRLIPMRTHLSVDLLSAILLLSSPWLFRFHATVFIPHVAAGIFEMAVVLLSRNGLQRRRLNSRLKR